MDVPNNNHDSYSDCPNQLDVNTDLGLHGYYGCGQFDSAALVGPRPNYFLYFAWNTDLIPSWFGNNRLYVNLWLVLNDTLIPAGVVQSTTRDPLSSHTCTDDKSGSCVGSNLYLFLVSMRLKGD